MPRPFFIVLVSDEFVVVPGGIGTVLELPMIWQLLQVRKLTRTSLILIGRVWADFVAWGRQYLAEAEFPRANRRPSCSSQRSSPPLR